MPAAGRRSHCSDELASRINERRFRRAMHVAQVLIKVQRVNGKRHLTQLILFLMCDTTAIFRMKPCPTWETNDAIAHTVRQSEGSQMCIAAHSMSLGISKVIRIDLLWRKNHTQNVCWQLTYWRVWRTHDTHTHTTSCLRVQTRSFARKKIINCLRSLVDWVINFV